MLDLWRFGHGISEYPFPAPVQFGTAKELTVGLDITVLFPGPHTLWPIPRGKVLITRYILSSEDDVDKIDQKNRKPLSWTAPLKECLLTISSYVHLTIKKQY